MGPNLLFSADLVRFTEEIVNGNFIFCVVYQLKLSEKIFKMSAWLLEKSQQCPVILLKTWKRFVHRNEVFPALLTGLSKGFHF